MDGVILSKSDENLAESLVLLNNKNEIMKLEGIRSPQFIICLLKARTLEFYVTHVLLIFR